MSQGSKKDGWFTLFCTSNVSLDKINDILTKACESASDASSTGWYSWLATQNFEDALPREKRPHGSDRMGTYRSACRVVRVAVRRQRPRFSGNGVDGSDGEAYLNVMFFAVLDDRTRADGSVVLCHVEVDGSVDWLRAWSKNASLYLSGMSVSSGSWDELNDSCNRHRERGEDVIE